MQPSRRTLGPSTLEGERKQVTVLFADLGGSFSAIEGVDPEEAESLLDAVVAAMVEAVHRFEGTVNQVLGDGIMALFGAPTSHEDHAVRAACAALAMQSSVRRLRSDSWAARRLTPEIRVGLNSGEVVIRTVPNDIGIEYRAIGPTTHLAARMEQLAPRGTIRLTEEVMQLGRGMLQARPLGAMNIKGLSKPVNAYELTGVATRTRFQATIERGLSPFVGREEQRELLVRALRSAVEGQSAAVVLVGEPGIGKSRLSHELLRSEDARACRVLEASALSYARATPHALVVGLLKSLFEIADGHGPDEIRAAVGAQLAALGMGDERLNVVLELLDVPTGEESWKRLDPVQRLQAIEQAVSDLLTRWCARAPSVILLEDLHWADDDSLAFVGKLLLAPPGRHTLVLATRRPVKGPFPDDDPRVCHCRLDALTQRDSQALVQALVGEDESLASLRRELVERTEGNPFFIEESARAYADMGVIEGSPGDYVLRTGTGDASVPAAVEALIGARLDRLKPEVLDTLQAAAVIGDNSPVEVLRTVTGAAEDVFRERFAVLAVADLLYETGPFRAPVFRFRHALLRDVVYGRMLRTRRRVVHGSVVDAFEKLYPARLGEHVERLAEHAAQAGQWARSARYHWMASTSAASRWANEQAIFHLERGIEVLNRMAPSAERDELAIDLRLVALAPLLPVGANERLIELLGEAEGFARAREDHKRLAKIYSQLGTAYWVTARYERAMEVATRARELAGELGDFALATAAEHCVGMVHHARGELEEALTVLEQVVAAVSGQLARRRFGWASVPSVIARMFIVSSCGLLGRFERADRTFAEAHAIAEELNHPYSRAAILEEYAFCKLVRGEIGEARAMLESAMSICEQYEVFTMHTPTAARLAMALAESGEVEAARALVADNFSREMYKRAGNYGLGFLLLARAAVELRAGGHSEALQAAERAEEVTRTVGERAYHVCALVQLGDVLARLAGQGDRVAHVYERAADEARALGMLPYVAFALEGRARVHAMGGAREPARVCLDSAEAIWRRVDAPARVSALADSRR